MAQLQKRNLMEIIIFLIIVVLSCWLGWLAAQHKYKNNEDEDTKAIILNIMSKRKTKAPSYPVKNTNSRLDGFKIFNPDEK